MSHSLLANHLQTELRKSSGKPRLQKITDFLTKRVFAWFYFYIVNRFGPKHAYVPYPPGSTGVFQAGASAVIGLAADWATDTAESVQIAACIAAHEPDYTVHLGDTHYVGAPHEIAMNFTDGNAPWPRGSRGGFALLGNHEMYARGIAFFDKLLPSIRQQAGYFCLENAHWRILGLDTGYHSTSKIPLLEMLPGFAPDCHLDAQLVTWLKEKVRLDDPSDRRGLVILTHHQYLSAFRDEGEYVVPAQQLARLIGGEREVIWLFGHEHKFSMYARAAAKDGVWAYGRCISHGGMPVEIASSTFTRNPSKSGDRHLVIVDDRQRTNAGGTTLGYNGYAVLKLDGDQLEITYCDAYQPLLTETWVSAGGKLLGQIQPLHSNLKPVPGRQWDDAVKP
jgi:hypothetical protein